jgi:hypothetical protein
MSSGFLLSACPNAVQIPCERSRIPSIPHASAVGPTRNPLPPKLVSFALEVRFHLHGVLHAIRPEVPQILAQLAPGDDVGRLGVVNQTDWTNRPFGPSPMLIAIADLHLPLIADGRPDDRKIDS